MTNVMYVVRLTEAQSPGITQTIEETRFVLNDDESWKDWDFKILVCNDNKDFEVKDFYSVIMRNPGPVIVLGRPVAKKVRQLQTRLYAKSSVFVSSEYDSDTFWSLIESAKEAFESGQPWIPRKYAAGLLIIKKLYAHKYWGGRDKNYIWRDDLPKGRGIDYTVIPKEVIFEALSNLIDKGYVSTKRGRRSQNGNKYCLNMAKRPEIEKILADESFQSDTSLERVLLRDTNRVNRDVLSWDSPKIVPSYTCGELGELLNLLMVHPDTIANFNIENGGEEHRKIPVGVFENLRLVFEISTDVWLIPATDGRCKATISSSNLDSSGNESLWIAISEFELSAGEVNLRDGWNAMSLVVVALKGFQV